MIGDLRAAQRFHCERATFDASTRTACLEYRLEPGPAFTETFQFAGESPPGPGFDVALRWLHLAAGVSYFKLAMPAVVRYHGRLSAVEQTFFEHYYREGLAELAYRNHLPLPVDLAIVADDDAAERRYAPLSAGLVVPLGGGKDSLVSCELLRASGRRFRTISVGRSELIADVAAAVGVEHVRIGRTLDPQLLDKNLDGYRGHVPITGLLAFALLCGSWLNDYDTVVMSNERSANEPTLITEAGVAVNHQYSKSVDFERAFADLLSERLDVGFRYFSLLRPWNELAIARRFGATTRYDGVFSSCNRNFRQDGQAASRRWCGDCPKCRFVYLAMAPFMDRPRMDRIFGLNPLDDVHQIRGYRALLAIDGHKPFECVGEVEESRVAIQALIQNPSWRECAVVAALAESSGWRTTTTMEVALRGDHALAPPAPFAELIADSS